MRRLTHHGRRIVPRISAASVRAVSTALAAVNTDHIDTSLQAYNATSRKSSPIASSSKVKLDTWLGVDPHLDRGADWVFGPEGNVAVQREYDRELAAPRFASEEELVAALTEPTLMLSPVAAYRALRSLSLFSHYLQSLGSRIKTVYKALRADGVTHNLLVSDLLLRYPDASMLREILIEEAAHIHNGPKADCLRVGLVAQTYRVVAPAVRQRTIPHLPAGTLAMVSHALQAHGHDDLVLLEDVFYELAHSSTFYGDDAWPCLEIVLHLAKHGRPERGLRLLQYPIALGKLPAAMGRTSSTHSEPATLMAQSAVVRCALYWGLDGRAQRSVTDLVTTMSRTAVSAPALDLVQTTVRAACVRRRSSDIAWAGRTLRAMVDDPAFPPLPLASVELYYAAASTRDALAFYEATPVHRAAPPDITTALRLVLASPRRRTLARLANELASHHDSRRAIPGILRALSSARLLRAAERLYNAWRTQNVLDSHTTLAMVRAFTRGARTKRNTALATTVLKDYLDTSRTLSGDKAVVAVHAAALLGEGVTREKTGVAAAERLIATLGQEGAAAALADLVTKHPTLAHRFAVISRTSGLPLPMPGVALAASCAAGHWGALAVAKTAPLSSADQAAVRSLTKARARRISAAVTQFAAACENYPGHPVLIPTAIALLNRCASLERWDAGFSVLLAVLPQLPAHDGPAAQANCAQFDAQSEVSNGSKRASTLVSPTQHAAYDGEEDIVEAACALVSRLSQVGSARRLSYAAHKPLLESRIQRLQITSRVLLSTALNKIGSD